MGVRTHESSGQLRAPGTTQRQTIDRGFSEEVKRDDGMQTDGDLDIEVYDVLLVHVLETLADLAHVAYHLRLGHLVVVVGDLIEQLAARQAATHDQRRAACNTEPRTERRQPLADTFDVMLSQ